MHGLINKAIQCFATKTYGADRWAAIVRDADIDVAAFEPMLSYDDALTDRILTALCGALDRPCDEVLEDLGTFLVSHPGAEGLRRLLRFGGVGYVDFLHSLDDLPDRVRLAVSDLNLPALELRELSAGRFSLTCGPGLPGFARVMMGVLRALADDYGALVTLEHEGRCEHGEVIAITVVETAFAAGRAFDLGARTG